MALTGGSARRGVATLAATLVLSSGCSHPGVAQDTTSVRWRNDSLLVRFVDADIRGVIQALGRYLPKPVLVGTIQPVKVSLETPAPVPRVRVLELLKRVVQSQGLAFTEDSTVYLVESPEHPHTRVGATGIASRGDTANVQLFVIRLAHARATDVAATVNLLFGGGGEFSGRSGLAAPTLSDELRRNVVPPTNAAPSGMGPPSTPSSPSPSALSGPVMIVPDQLTNSLLIRATQQDFHLLAQAVEQLDIRPLQVLIEVLIVEARRDRTFSLAADVLVPPQPTDKSSGTIQGTSSAGGGLGDLVIQLMNLGHARIDAALRVAASRGDVRIVSRPVLLASNNTEAKLLVGSQVPFVQVSRSLPTETPTRDQVVQYKDVGTKLTIKPTINQDGYVSLVIQQEVNAATTEILFDAPVISTREAATQVLVKDGQTIVLGGLHDQQRTASRAGIPILSSLPILGGLFGIASRNRSETELYLFLTPRILKTDADADSVTAPRLPKGGR